MTMTTTDGQCHQQSEEKELIIICGNSTIKYPYYI